MSLNQEKEALQGSINRLKKSTTVKRWTIVDETNKADARLQVCVCAEKGEKGSVTREGWLVSGGADVVVAWVYAGHLCSCNMLHRRAAGSDLACVDAPVALLVCSTQEIEGELSRLRMWLRRNGKT